MKRPRILKSMCVGSLKRPIAVGIVALYLFAVFGAHLLNVCELCDQKRPASHKESAFVFKKSKARTEEYYSACKFLDGDQALVVRTLTGVRLSEVTEGCRLPENAPDDVFVASLLQIRAPPSFTI